MAKSSRFGLLGQNISYSKSADIFQAIFEQNGLDGTFENFDLTDATFETEFKQIIENGIDGLSVTIPFKSKVIPFLDEVSAVANALDAVNSVAIANKVLYGYNTDTSGFSMPLVPHSAKLKNGTALILGAGGSARAVVYALHTDHEVAQLVILGRDKYKLSSFETSMKKILLNAEINTLTFEEFASHSHRQISIVVNCTPLGGWNQPDKNPLPKHFDLTKCKIYYDLNYNNGNRLIKSARNSGLTTFDGSRMLVGQALRSFEIWTGETADFESIYERVFGKLKHHNSNAN